MTDPPLDLAQFHECQQKAFELTRIDRIGNVVQKMITGLLTVIESDANPEELLPACESLTFERGHVSKFDAKRDDLLRACLYGVSQSIETTMKWVAEREKWRARKDTETTDASTQTTPSEPVSTATNLLMSADASEAVRYSNVVIKDDPGTALPSNYLSNSGSIGLTASAQKGKDSTNVLNPPTSEVAEDWWLLPVKQEEFITSQPSVGNDCVGNDCLPRQSSPRPIKLEPPISPSPDRALSVSESAERVGDDQSSYTHASFTDASSDAPDDVGIWCDICDVHLSSETSLIRHKDIEHRAYNETPAPIVEYISTVDAMPNITNNGAEIPAPPAISYYQREVCETIRKDLPSLAQRVDAHQATKAPSKQKVGCPLCGKQLCREYLASHIAVIHKKNAMPKRRTKKNTCAECGIEFARSEQLKRHMFSHTGSLPFKCPCCEERFDKKSSIWLHVTSMHKS